jgi:hypothetical protein
MNRTRSAGECPTCKQAPKEDESGRLTCACGIWWFRRSRVKGTPEEEALLEQSGFRVAEVPGDVYYLMPEGGHIIYLYSDGTWDSDKAPRGQPLEDYLAWIREKLAAVGKRY